MKKHIILSLSVVAILAMVFTACNKEKDPEPTKPTGCADGSICFTLDGTAISKAAGGYYFADTFLFVKYEEGLKQLSIDIFGKATGNYMISNVRKVGNARIYYFPDNSNTMYMAANGSFNVSELTTDKKITGTFSGTLYKYDNTNETYTYTDSVVIKDGSFTKAQLTN